jgi:hypothetical protein
MTFSTRAYLDCFDPRTKCVAKNLSRTALFYLLPTRHRQRARARAASLGPLAALDSPLAGSSRSVP